MKKKRVLIAVPRWGTDPPEAADYRVETMGYCMKWQGKSEGVKDDSCPYEFYTGSAPDMIVSLARETICRTAVQGGFDYVGMIDDDMRGPIDLWPRLLAHDVDVVAPLAFTRQPPCYPVVYAVKEGWDNSGTHYTMNTHIIRNYPKNQLFEVDACGFGAVLIKVDVLKRMQEPWFFTSNTDIKNATGEDIFFCVEAAKAGARIWCDSGTKMLHLGPRTWVGEEEYEKQNPDMVELRKITGDWSRKKNKENLAS